MKKRRIAMLAVVILILILGYATFHAAEKLIRSAAPVLNMGDTPK